MYWRGTLREIHQSYCELFEQQKQGIRKINDTIHGLIYEKAILPIIGAESLPHNEGRLQCQTLPRPFPPGVSLIMGRTEKVNGTLPIPPQSSADLFIALGQDGINIPEPHTERLVQLSESDEKIAPLTINCLSTTENLMIIQSDINTSLSQAKSGI